MAARVSRGVIEAVEAEEEEPGDAEPGEEGTWSGREVVSSEGN